MLRMMMPRPRHAPHVLCEPAQSNGTWTCHKSHVKRKFTGKCHQMPRPKSATPILRELAQSKCPRHVTRAMRSGMKITGQMPRPKSTCYTPHLTLYTVRSTLNIAQHSTLHTLHSTLFALDSALYTPLALFRHLNFQQCSERVCCADFDFAMCFAPQRRPLFRHLNFQKCSESVCRAPF